MEGAKLKAGEKREVKLVLSINDTNEIKTYINKLTTKGEIKEKVVFIIDGEIKREKEVTEGTVIERPDFEIEELDGWYTDSNYTNKYKFSNRVNKDLILYARTNEEKPKYQVRYIDKNEVIKTEEVEEGNKTTAPETDPSKRGYRFNCWKKGNACFNFENEINEDTDLISDYNIITYDITYNLQGGTVTGNPDTYTVETDTFTLNNPEKEGCTFIGWTGSNGDVPSLTVTLPEEELGDKNYTANYSINRYELEIDPKGGSYPGELLIEGDYGEIISISEPTKEGYNFTGWTLTGAGTYNNGIYTFGEGNGKLEATYEIIEYEIEYKGITEEERSILNNPTSYNIETTEFTLRNPANRLNEDNEGEVFIGWKEKTAETPSINISLPDRNNLGKKEYTAMWEEREADEWIITYNLNGGEVTGNPNKYRRSTLPITLNNPRKDGYEFKGWTGSNGEEPSNVTIPKGTEGDLSYTANYNIKNYTITYDYSSCNLTNEEITALNNRGSYTIEDSNFILNNPNKYGYVFEGWTGTDLTNKTINVTVDTSKIKNLSYKANCILDTYDVEFYNMKSNGTYELNTTVEDIEYNTSIPSNKIPTVSLRGYTFKYWSLDKTNEFNLSTPILEDTKLYAVYEKDIYPITYNLEGGLLEEDNPESYSVDTDEFTLNNPSKTGYEFIGWTGSNGDSPLKVITLPEEELGPKSYTANYIINKYTVTYMNGETKHDEEEVEYNEKATGNVETPTKAHNVFKGWTLNNNLYDFDTLVTENITLYASWEEVESPLITHSPTTWAKDKVTVTIGNKGTQGKDYTGYSYKYKIGSGNYQDYNGPFEVTENTTIYAYSVKGGISSIEESHEINNIDKINPNINSLEEVAISPSSVTINIKVQDLESGSNIIKIFLNGVVIFENPSYVSDLNEEKELEYTVTDLEQLTTYTIKAEIIDKVGNVSSEEIEITTPEKHYVARTVDEDGTEIERYETLKLAIESTECVGICRIEMLDNVEETNAVLEGQDIKLDLNGFTITGLTDKAFENNGILQIVDYNEDEIGKIYSSGTAIVNTGRLFVGENEETLVVSKTEPIIEGSVTGVDSPGELHFYDGKIIGGSTTGALKGTAPITPYSYNASVETLEGKEIATLEIIADAEARINSVYYTKVQEAIDASKNGRYEKREGTTEIMSQIESTQNYRFDYDPVSKTITSNNKGKDNSVANSYIKIDLTDSEVDKALYVNASVSSQQGYDFGYVTVTNSNAFPSYDQENGRIIFLSGVYNDSATTILEKGKVYYLHIGYRKNESYSSNNDEFIINDIKLYDYDLSNVNELKDGIVTDSSYHLSKNTSGDYESNLSVQPNVVSADSYLKVDMTGINTEKVLYVDATYNTNNGSDYSYIIVSDSREKPDTTIENNRYTMTSGRRNYEVHLKPNQINYVHFTQYKGWWQSTINCIVHSVRLEDEIYKEHLNSDIVKSEPWYFYETNIEPNVWKDLSGNDKDGKIYGLTLYNETTQGLEFNGTGGVLTSGLTSTPLTEETVEVEYSTTNGAPSAQILYNGCGNEKLAIGLMSNYMMISNENSGETYNIPENYADGNKHTITVTFGTDGRLAYFDGEPLTRRGENNSWHSNGNSYIGRNKDGYSFKGTIYSVKVFDKKYTEEEINNKDYNDDNLLLYLDSTNRSKTMDTSAFINNNQYQANTTAYSYMVFDLRSLTSNKNMYVNAEISSELNRDYGFITLKSYDDIQETIVYPEYNDWGGRYVNISGEVTAQDYTVTLTAGKVNYLFFGYRKDGGTDSGKDTFKINNVKYYEDSESTIPTYVISNGTSQMHYNDVPVLNEDVDTVQILRNITMTNPLEIIETRDVILDLNGYTLTTAKEDYVIKNKGSLTIIDSDFDNQSTAAQEKYNRELAEFNHEYETKNQEKDDYYAEKQAEYDQEYNDEIAYYNQKKEEAGEKFNELAEEYLEYMNSDEYISTDHFDYDYTGEYEEFVAPKTAIYTIELWGASGSGTAYGGYTKGEIELTQGEKLYIYVGDKYTSTPDTKKFNSGTGSSGGYNGGGSTDVRLVGGSWDDFDSLKSRIMVAGAGGAGNSHAGAAGGLEGYSDSTPGGTQTTYGSTAFYTASAFGIANGGCTGGNGYYPGGGASCANGAGGGSSYISGHEGVNSIDESSVVNNVIHTGNKNHYSGKVFTNTIMVDGQGYKWTNVKTDERTGMPSYQNGSTEYGNTGKGHARISYQNESSSYTIEDAKNALKVYKNNFSYTGNYQEFVAPVTANYTIEAWGAQGGIGYFSTQPTPGKGAYTKGTISLNKGEKIYIYVGGQGGNATSASSEAKAGYNGGASGTRSSDGDDASGAGGGATDIRLVASDWNDSQSLASRIMVAGGGGGSHSTSTTSYVGGMDAGALQVTGQLSTWQNTWTPIVNQTEGGSFGYGINATANHAGSGGGGGYYGGYSTIINGFSGRASGGSSYISGYTGSVAVQAEDNTNPKYGCDNGTDDITCSYHYSGKIFTETVMKSGSDSMPSYNSDDLMVGNTGNGFARISFADANETYETPNEKYDSLIESLGVADYFDFTSYSNNKWNNVLDGNKSIVSGDVNKTDEAVRVNNIDSRSVVKVPIDNSSDTIIYSLVKVNRNYDNSKASRIFEVYSGLDFYYNTPLIHAYNNQLCVDSYNRGSCTSNIDFNGYNLITMTINNTTKMLRLYINGTYMTEVSYNNYGNMLNLSHSNNGDVGEYGDNSFKMLAIGNTIPTDEDIMKNSKAIIKLYNESINEVVVKKDATTEPNYIYNMEDYITDGLQLHYDGINNGNTENIWEDISGNNYNGTLTNVNYNSDKNCYIFKGNSSVTLSSSPITIDKEETVEVMFSTLTRGNQVIYNGANNQKIGIGLWSGYVIVTNKNSNAYTYEIPSNLDDGNPHTMSVVYNNGELTAYFDSISMIKRTNTNYWGSNADLYLGRRSDGNYFTGNIYNLKVYDRALRNDEITRNYNVNITRYNVDAEIIKRVPTMDESYQNGKVTSTTYNTIWNNGHLDIKQAIVDINKEGYYNAVDNLGTLTMEDDGYVNALRNNNRGIYNSWYGDMLDGNGTISANASNSNCILNESGVDEEFGGYKLVTNNTGAWAVNNQAKNETTMKNLDISGSGTGIYQGGNKKLTVKDSTINSTNQNSVVSNSTSIESEIVLDNIEANSTILNDSGSNRIITIKNSKLETDHSLDRQVYNASGKMYINDTELISCANYQIVLNYGTVEFNDTVVTVPSTCGNAPHIVNGEPGATMVVNNIEFNKHNTAYPNDTNNGDRGLIRNQVQATLTVNGGSINTDNYYPYGISNGGGTLYVKGEFENSENFGNGIYNYSKGYWYHNYNPVTYIGEDDENVSTEYPKIRGNDSGVFSQDKNKDASYGALDNQVYFYDGAIIGKKDDALHASISGKPENYDLNVDELEEKEIITLKPENSTVEKDYVARIGSTKYSTIQAAVDAVPDNTETEIVIIKDIETAANVNINENKDVIINLNNHSIKSHIYEDYIINDGKLQMVDNSGETVTKTNKHYSNSFVTNNGTFIYDDIILVPQYTDSYLLINNGTATINGGTLKSGGRTISNNGILTINDVSLTRTSGNYSLVEGLENGDVIINDGYYQNAGTNYMFDITKNIDIHGGIFIPNGTTVINNKAGSIANIDGGSFDATLNRSGSVNYNNKLINNTGIATIENITSNYCYVASNASTGTLTVNNFEDNNIANDALGSSGNLYVNNLRSSSGASMFNISNSLDNEVRLNNIALTNAQRDSGTVIISGTNNDIIINNSLIQGSLNRIYGGTYGLITITENSSNNIEIINSDIKDLKTDDCNGSCKEHSVIYLNNGSSGRLKITSGNILSVTSGTGILNKGTSKIILGEEGGVPSKTNPRIEGKLNGIMSTNGNSSLDFYDGIVIGDEAISSKIENVETGYEIITGEENDKEAKYLDKVYVIQNKTKIDAIVNPTEEDINQYKYYSIQDGIDAADNGDELQILRNFTSTPETPTITNNKNISLDLNSYKLIQNNEKFIINTGDLLITDSTVDHEGSVEDNSGLSIENSGTLTLTNIKVFSTYRSITKLIQNNENASITVNNSVIEIPYGTLFDNSGLLTINSGSFTSTTGEGYGNTPYNQFENRSTGEIIVNDGEFNHNGTASMFYNRNNLTINDGSFLLYGIYRWNNNDYSAYTYATYTEAGATTNILGGTYGDKSNNASTYGTLLYNSGTINVKNVHSELGGLGYNTGTVTIEDSDIVNLHIGANYTYDRWNTYMYLSNIGGSVDISGSTFVSYANYYILYSIDSSSYNVDNCSFSGPQFMNIYDDANGSTNERLINVSNSTINTSGTGVNISGNKNTIINLSDNTITSTGGTAIVVGNKYNAESTQIVNVISGSVTSNNGIALKNEGNGIINVGALGGNVSKIDPALTGKTYGFHSNNNTGENNFYDGIISGTNAIEGTIDNIEPNYSIITEVNDGVESKYLDLTFAFENVTKIHAYGDSDDYRYYNMQSAIDDASNGDELRVLRDITYLSTDSAVTNSKTVTIDLNNYKITSNIAKLINNTGDLIITDKSQDKRGNIQTNIGAIIDNNGTFNLSGGELYTNIASISNILINNENSTMNITGGKIHTYTTTLIDNSGLLTISGGELYDTFNYDGYNNNPNTLIKNETTGTINVSGGTITYHGGNGAINNDNICNITGGSFDIHNGTPRGAGHVIYNNQTGTATVTGGTYDNLASDTRFIYNVGTASISGITSTFGIFAYNNGDMTISSVISENLRYTGIHNDLRGTMLINDSSFKGGQGSALLNSGTVTTTNTNYESSNRDQDGYTIRNNNTGYIKFNSGSISSTGGSYGALHAGDYSTIDIETATINSYNTAIAVDKGTVNFKDGSLVSTNGNGIDVIRGTLNYGVSGGVPSITKPSIYAKVNGINHPNNTSSFYFYDGSIKGETGSIYGTITDTEAGYKEKRDNVTDPDTLINSIESTLTVIGTSERVAMVNGVNFLSLQSAVNYASNNGIEGIQMFKSITLESDLVKPEGGSNVKIYLGNFTITEGSYTIGEGIELVEGMDPGASISRFLANISREEINPKNIVIYEMGDGSSLEANITYKLYKEMDGEEKIVKVKENKIGDYDLGTEGDTLRTVRSRIYINNIGEGTYKLVGSDSKEIVFTISHDGVSNNIRENNNINGSRVSNAIATLILTLQTGITRHPYILIIMILMVISLGFVAYQKYKKEEN